MLKRCQLERFLMVGDHKDLVAGYMSIFSIRTCEKYDVSANYAELPA